MVSGYAWGAESELALVKFSSARVAEAATMPRFRPSWKTGDFTKEACLWAFPIPCSPVFHLRSAP